MKYLVVVDMQNDFIDGALGTSEAEKIVPKVKEYIENFDGEVIFTRDTHGENYLSTEEGKNLPVPHCIKGTAGWQICDALRPLIKSEPIDKGTFGSKELVEFFSKRSDVESITFLGLCTDICVISNALLIKAYYPEIPLFVYKDGCAGVTPKSHENALKSMETCQIKVV